MKNIDSIPHLLNGIFNDLAEVSRVVVCCQATTPTIANPMPPRCRVVSVNGYPSVSAYTGAMNDLRANLIARFVEVQQEFSPDVRPVLIRQALVRCRKHMQAVTPSGDDRAPGLACPAPCNNTRMFRNPVCICNGMPVGHEGMADEIRMHTSRFAAVYYNTVWKIELEMHLAYCLFEVLPCVQSPEQPGVAAPEKYPKLLVKTNVPILAAFGRMLFDCNAFEINNRSMFCRIVVFMFCTRFKQSLSSKSFKNHFDAPTPETYKKLDEELGKMQQYLRNFKFSL